MESTPAFPEIPPFLPVIPLRSSLRFPGSFLGLVAFLLVGLLLSVVLPEAEAKEAPVCQGPYNGKKVTPSQLTRIVSAHTKWRVSPQKSAGKMANLCGADLRDLDLEGINLEGANLRGANLQGIRFGNAVLGDSDLRDAHLEGAILTGANFRHSDLRNSHLIRKAHLTGAILDGADLQTANLEEVDLTGLSIKGTALNSATLRKANLMGSELLESGLSGAHLEEADLSKTDLRKVNLEDAHLEYADLSGADLRDAHMKRADLSGTDVTGVIFELRPETIPDVRSMARARNLWRMTYVETPLSLVELREEFRKSGMRDQERQITFSIKHTERKRLWERDLSGKVESVFLFIFFEYTSQYGMTPGQPLRLLAIMLIVLIPFYIWSMIYRKSWALILATCPYTRQSEGYYKSKDVFVKARADFNELEVVVTRDFFFPSTRDWLLRKQYERLRWAFYAAALILGAAYFSLLSAFRLGWRDLNVGTWISRIQPRDFQLRGIGLVKLVSGTQSLLSVYLLALWVLTYFTRIFQ